MLEALNSATAPIENPQAYYPTPFLQEFAFLPFGRKNFPQFGSKGKLTAFLVLRHSRLQAHNAGIEILCSAKNRL
jgi:hypothetical protein